MGQTGRDGLRHPSRAANGALAVFWFDLVGSISYAFLAPWWMVGLPQ
jgi:hypothetical protein